MVLPFPFLFFFAQLMRHKDESFWPEFLKGSQFLFWQNVAGASEIDMCFYDENTDVKLTQSAFDLF